MAGSIFGEQAAKGEVFVQMNRFLGNEAAARAIEDLVLNAARPRTGTLATVLSFFALWFGASGVFGQIKGALDITWGVERKPGAGMLPVFLEYAWSVVDGRRGRTVAFGVARGQLGLDRRHDVCRNVDGHIGSDAARREWIASLAVLTILFGMIFKLLPDVVVRSRDVWVGALTTAILFSVGKFLIGWYLARLVVASAYGAAGSFVLVLVWTYYSEQIFLLGAEVTQAYARHLGAPGTSVMACSIHSHGGRRRAGGEGGLVLVGPFVKTGTPRPLETPRTLGAAARGGAMIAGEQTDRMSTNAISEDAWSPRRIVEGTLVVCAVIALFALALTARHVLFFLFIAIVLSTALEPLIALLSGRGVPRLASIAIVYSLLLTTLVAPAVIGLPLLVDQSQQVLHSLPESYSDFRDRVGQISSTVAARLPEQPPWVDREDEVIEGALSALNLRAQLQRNPDPRRRDRRDRDLYQLLVEHLRRSNDPLDAFIPARREAPRGGRGDRRDPGQGRRLHSRTGALVPGRRPDVASGVPDHRFAACVGAVDHRRSVRGRARVRSRAGRDRADARGPVGRSYAGGMGPVGRDRHSAIRELSARAADHGPLGGRQRGRDAAGHRRIQRLGRAGRRGAGNPHGGDHSIALGSLRAGGGGARAASPCQSRRDRAVAFPDAGPDPGGTPANAQKDDPTSSRADRIEETIETIAQRLDESLARKSDELNVVAMEGAGMRRLAAATALVLATLAFMAVLWELRGAVLIFFLSLGTSAALRPAIEQFHRWGLPRGWPWA